MPSTSPKKASDSSGLGVSSSTGPRWAMSGGSAIEPLPETVDLPRERAAREPLALDALGLLAGERRGQHRFGSLRLDHGAAVGVEHDDVAGADDGAADRDRDVELAPDRLVGAPDADPARPDGQAHVPELLGVADGGVDED